MKRYNPKEIEPIWQKWWDENQTYKADLTSDKPKYIGMSMFNYPSGAGIHIGHAMNYTISDVMARFKRQQGYESYHPVGWDAFGLPAENYAIKAGVSPQASMAKIIPDYHTQYKAMGWSNDWSKEIATHEPRYYKWTQWIFTQMHKHGLAYQDSRMQWWCEKDNTVLANEQVIDGKCWRHDGPDDPLVEKKEIKQWFFKITDYADELLEATEDLDWTESVKLAQKNWIGKSKGAEITFNVDSERNYVLLHGYTGDSSRDFFPWLKANLEKQDCEVYAPDLPNTEKPDAKEQASYVLENAPFDENTVMLGHSYGSVTAMRILEQLDKPIAKLVLAAGFAQPGFNDNERPFEATTDWNFDFEKIKKNVKEIVFLRDAGDPAVPKERADYLQEKLGGRIVDFKAEEGHICGKEEPIVLQNVTDSITVFTTRPDTIFGATFLVMAPENEQVLSITSPGQIESVMKYQKEAAKKTEVERQASKQKTGVFTGAYVTNPASGEKMPVWIADYVLNGYGTGAIMAVPAHDERDYEFAQKFELPINQVIMPCESDPINPPQAGFEEVERPTVIVHLLDKSTGKYAVLDWHETLEGITTAIMGGIDDGESPEEAALKEIAEEAGLKNVTITHKLRWITGAKYCASHKKQNRKAITWGLLAEVDNLEGQAEIAADELKIHTLTWVDKGQVLERLTPAHQKQVWELLWNETPLTGEGEIMNSGAYNGMNSAEAREKIVADLEIKGAAKEVTNYKLRDWSVGRQRYWGAPIPIINCEKCGQVLVPEDELPVVLPELQDFEPNGDGRSALARATEWLKVPCPQCGGEGERETDTLDTYICSSWYMLRYLDPDNDQAPFGTDIANKWMPIDFYNGGDHATAHMMYARFVTRFFHKLGLVNNPEPFKKFLFNGKVTAANGEMFSKSKGNGVDPLEIIGQGYGADALRIYLMFAAPLDMWIRWDKQGVPGAYRFISRIWNLVQEFNEKKIDGDTDAPLKAVHPAIKKVTQDLEDQKYNTAIAAMMKATNDLYEVKAKDGYKGESAWQDALESLVMLIAPFAPHAAEELWHDLGHEDSVNRSHWPEWDEKYLASDNITIAVQINGKLRSTIEVPNDSVEEQVVAAARADSKVQAYLMSEPKKTIYVKGRLLNFVV